MMQHRGRRTGCAFELSWMWTVILRRHCSPYCCLLIRCMVSYGEYVNLDERILSFWPGQIRARTKNTSSDIANAIDILHATPNADTYSHHSLDAIKTMLSCPPHFPPAKDHPTPRTITPESLATESYSKATSNSQRHCPLHPKYPSPSISNLTHLTNLSTLFTLNLPNKLKPHLSIDGNIRHKL